MGVTQYRSNPNWDHVIESLLRLGDVSRNNQLGEVRAALAKAEMLIKKYHASAHANLLHQLQEKLLRHERGEKVSEQRTADFRASHTGPHPSNDAEEQAWRAWKRAHWGSDFRTDPATEAKIKRKWKEKAARAAYRARRKAERATFRKAERAKRKEKARAAYAPDGKRVRFYMHDRIEWLVTFNPRTRGKARLRFQQVVNAQTVGEFFDRGGLKRDLRHYIIHGYIKVHKT